MMTREISGRIMISVVFSIFLMISVHADGMIVGVSPPRIYAEHLMNGSDFTARVMLTKSSVQELSITIETAGMAGSWLMPEHETEFMVPEGLQQVPLNFRIHVPDDAEVGNYIGRVNVRARPVAGAGLGSEIVLPVNIMMNVTDTIFLNYSVRAMQIKTNGSVIRIIADIDNRGNINAGPKMIKAVILDRLRKKTQAEVRFTDISAVSPFTRKQLSFDINSSLVPGQYWARVIVYSDDCSDYSGDGPDGDGVIAKEDIAFDITDAADELVFDAAHIHAKVQSNTQENVQINNRWAKKSMKISFAVLAMMFLLIIIRKGAVL